MDFSGAVNEEVVVPDHADVNSNSQGYTQKTVELWFNALAEEDSNEHNRTMVCLGNGAESGLNVFVSESAAGQLELRMFVWDRDNHDSEYGTALVNPEPISCAITKGTTYYAALVFNGKGDNGADTEAAPARTVTGYIGQGGTLTKCGEITDLPIGIRLKHVNDGEMVIGGIATSTRTSGTDLVEHNSVDDSQNVHNFKGAIDDVAVYNRPLKMTELEEHFSVGWHAPPPPRCPAPNGEEVRA